MNSSSEVILLAWQNLKQSIRQSVKHKFSKSGGGERAEGERTVIWSGVVNFAGSFGDFFDQRGGLASAVAVLQFG
jgi:hypothetical protein